ncbi:hypothetical protein [Paenibacillus mesophilus]|uniref:hypothetical protein n=1 Tax=Paenibacillus mesophilus TaxID=2582849 RepID=UPI001EE41270|nr:hypothetical protein [Paenibacillus mesophilus]
MKPACPSSRIAKTRSCSQELLIQQDGFFKTPYIGQHGWVSVKNPQNWDMLEDLLKEAYLRAAPKRLAKQFMP